MVSMWHCSKSDSFPTIPSNLCKERSGGSMFLKDDSAGAVRLGAVRLQHSLGEKMTVDWTIGVVLMPRRTKLHLDCFNAQSSLV